MTIKLEHKYIMALCDNLGQSNRAIAARLDICPHTVATTLSIIYKKYGLRGRNSRIRLAVMAINRSR